MASKTKKLEFIRERKRSTVGTKRKASLRTKGSTKSKKVIFGD
jgi:hypothetical protein